MRLNEEQMMVIKAVRDHMATSGYSYYICHAISHVLMDMRAKNVLPADTAVRIKIQLVVGIVNGIGNMVTFGGFMRNTCPVIESVHDRGGSDYENLMFLARIAWLDWIIHTGEIKAEKLLGDD